jgi:hypothetical protein
MLHRVEQPLAQAAISFLLAHTLGISPLLPGGGAPYKNPPPP